MAARTCPEWTIRRAARADAAAINDIQNHYVERSTATFLTEPLTLEERLAWFDSHTERQPITVAVTGENVIGWGALGTFRPRAAYDGTT